MPRVTGRGWPEITPNIAQPPLTQGQNAIAPTFQPTTLALWTPKIIRGGLDYDLTNAQTSLQIINESAAFMMVNDATDDNVMVRIQFINSNNEPSAFYNVRRGYAIGGFPFKQMFMSNLAQPGKTIQIIWCLDWKTDPIEFP